MFSEICTVYLPLSHHDCRISVKFAKNKWLLYLCLSVRSSWFKCSFTSFVHSVNAFIQFMWSFSSRSQFVLTTALSEFLPFGAFFSVLCLHCLRACSVDYLPVCFYSGLLREDFSVELLPIRLFFFLVVPPYLRVIMFFWELFLAAYK